MVPELLPGQVQLYVYFRFNFGSNAEIFGIGPMISHPAHRRSHPCNIKRAPCYTPHINFVDIREFFQLTEMESQAEKRFASAGGDASSGSKVLSRSRS